MTKRIHELEELCDLIVKNREAVVLIGGCSRSGKSTLAKQIEVEFEREGHSVQMISLDNWILDYRDRTSDMNVFDRFQFSLLQNDITSLLERESIWVLGYNPKTRKVEEDRGIAFQWVTDYLIIEGVLGLFLETEVTNEYIKIYTDVEDDIRKKRLFDFYTKHKGLDERSAKEIIEERENEEVETIKSSKQKASIIFTPN